MGGGEVAAADFLAGMAETGAAEGFGVAGTGLTAAELGATGAAAGTDMLASGALQQAGTAGGISSLSPTLQTAISNTAAVNAPVAQQMAQAAAAGATPPATAAIGAGQIGDVATRSLAGGAGGIEGLQAGNFAKPIPAEVANLTSQLGGGLAGPGVDLASTGNAGVADALARTSAQTAPTSYSAFGEPVPVGSPAALSADPTGLAQMQLDANAAAAASSANPFSTAYEAWKNSDPLIKYGSAGIAAMKYLGKPTAAYSPPGYSGPLSRINISPNYQPYVYKPYAAGGPVEQMSNENAIGANTGYPQADINQGAYATPWQTPVSRNVVTGPSDANVDQMTGDERLASGGIASLGSYSDGGRLLKGPGDGMSDGIPATISNKQPARLADGEFVVPADVVSGLGNGSTDAGAKHLYGMMDKVRQARTGTKKQGKQINPHKYMPA